MSLERKVVYITGGSKGIGFGVAKKLVSEGMKVAISGRNLKTVTQAATYLGDSSNVLAIASDVTKLDSEKAAIEKIIATWGQVDVVLANAGIGHFAPVDELGHEQWHSMINTNLNGVFHTLKAAVEALKKSKGYYMTLASLAA